MKTHKKNTFTKVAVKALLIVGVINAMIPFLLSAFDKAPVTELGIAWISEIVAVILGYLLKSYHETKQERKQNHADFVAGMKGDFSDGRDEFYDSENCG